MPTVIDSLILEFNLDTSQFTREQRRLLDQIRKMQEEAKQRATDFEGSMKKMFSAFTNLQRMGIGAIAGFFGAREIERLIQMIEHFNRMELQVGRLAETMNIGAGSLLAWGTAFKALGLDAQAGMGALDSVTSQLIALSQRGETSNLTLFAGSLGISPTKRGPTGAQEPKTAPEFVMEIAAALDRLGLTGIQRRGKLEGMGISGDLLYLLMNSAQTIKAVVDKQKELLPLTEKETEAAARRHQAMTNVETAFTHLGVVIVDALTPAIVAVSNIISNVVTFLTNKFGNWITGGGPAASVEALTGVKAGTPPNAFWAKVAEGREERLRVTPSNVPLIGQGGTGIGGGGEHEAFIRETSKLLGLDPNMTAWIYAHEGKGGIGPRRQSTFPGEQSFGDFQLNMRQGALGQMYQKETGHLPGDPQYWKEEDTWALTYMKKHGLSPWSSWMNAGGGAFAGGAGQQTINYNIGTMNVNGDNSREVASNLEAQLRRQHRAILANGGAQ